MSKNPPFYVLFVMLDCQTKVPKGGNCFCAAGTSQSCVHIAAMLFTLAEVTAMACTSVRCAWTRPSAGNKVSASFSRELDFGNASQDGYFPYNGPKPSVDTLLTMLANAASKPVIIDFLDGEKERVAREATDTSHSNEVLKDPLDKLASIVAVREPTVDDLVDALCVTDEESELIQLDSVTTHYGWMRDSGESLQVTLGKSAIETLECCILRPLRGRPKSAAINWGCDIVALEAYQQRTTTEVDMCGLFLSTALPFLGATPDGLIYAGLGAIGILEVKCPYKHRNSTIVDACKDSGFCLSIGDLGQPLEKKP